MDDTPLGRIISIRAETDKEAIKKFNPSEKKIYDDWLRRRIRNKLDSMTEEEKKKRVSAFQEAVKSAFYKGGK